jgi:hypothetical protein
MGSALANFGIAVAKLVCRRSGCGAIQSAQSRRCRPPTTASLAVAPSFEAFGHFSRERQPTLLGEVRMVWLPWRAARP